jgi:hypothetical protein
MTAQHIDFIGEIRLREATVATGVPITSYVVHLHYQTRIHAKLGVAEVAAVAIQQNQWVTRLPVATAATGP